jgi:D-arabinose 1-dehydrogenase-like Zn-dependent alcohol dehydrogenase
MADVWRDGTMAEYVKMPLENCYPLNEERLCRELGYTLPDLMYLLFLLVPYGGLRDIDVQPGETVVVCPATGGFSAAGVLVAAGMGAKVIAASRNEKELARVKKYVRQSQGSSIETVAITGDEAADMASIQRYGSIDAIIDLTPFGADESTHLKTAMQCLRRGGRVSLMGLVNFGKFASPWLGGGE